MALAISSVEKELIKGIVDIARHKEFYGHIIQQFERVMCGEGHRIETAAVGRVTGERFIKLYLNRGFFTNIFSKNERTKAWNIMLGVIEHEIIHVVFGHLFLKFQDTTRGNVAVDLVVNSVLSKDVLPEGAVFPEDYGFEKNKAALWYYTHLKDNKKYQQQCASGAFGAGGMMSHILSSHGMWSDLKDDLVAKELAKDIVRKAKDLCHGKNYGNIPGEVISQIDDLLKKDKAIIPWGRVLRMFVASCQESILDYTVKRISRRYNTRPGTRKGDVLNIAVGVDTSGSISDDQLLLFFNEIRWIWKNGANVTIIEADASIQSKYKFKGKFDGKIHGRGGTDLNPVVQEVEGKYDALIYFTDFYAPEVKRARIPTLWVLHTQMDPKDYPAKWGRHIRIEDGKAA